MDSRASFLRWYVLIRGILRDLVSNLSDVEVMEYVSGDVLTVPLVGTGEESRPMPVLEITPGNDWVTISLVYRDAEAMKHLENILHPSQSKDLGQLEASLRALPSAFETCLLKRGFKEDAGFVLSRKYVASRVDGSILRLLIGESKVIRSGGRRNVDGRSVYEAPATPILQLNHIKVKATDGEFNAAVVSLKPTLAILSAAKTQREIIHSRFAKPVNHANKYRDFIELLNKARGLNVVFAEERRGLDKRWREVPEERGPIEEDLKRRLGPT